MATLYIRDMDEAVTEVLKQRAAASGMSLSAYVAAELTRIARRPTNAEVVERLRSRDRTDPPSVEDVLEARDSERR